MKRKRLGEEADRQRIIALLKENNPGWKQTRLAALKMGFLGETPVNFIAESLGISPSSVSRWFATFRRDGLDAVLTRGYGIGRPSGLNETIKDYLEKGLKEARWNTAGQAQAELEKEFKEPFNYKTVWVWLKKCAGVLRVPRPVHQKRDSCKADAFKEGFLDVSVTRSTFKDFLTEVFLYWFVRKCRSDKSTILMTQAASTCLAWATAAGVKREIWPFLALGRPCSKSHR